eukprot:TRINITY_DN1050_c0_g1_i1.p1 TRINITY_DN1050_c0_g1~~TRINITY_DN1050_c0_g1_i1.p1  ORF type:complete len:695 (-),score=203.49 TRINITY_DN1050_c0_g1_i1:51-2135(-)
MMKVSTSVFFILSVVAALCYAEAPIPDFRPPSVPLIVSDPFFSVWSGGDSLTDTWPTLWDGTTKGMIGMIRVDGNAYRWMGPGNEAGGTLPNPAQQLSVTVYPTNTVYVFSAGGVELTVTFTTPMMTNGGYDLLSRPVTYLTLSAATVDQQNHTVSVYYDTTAEISVNTIDEQVVWSRQITNQGLQAMRIGTQSQNVLGNSGDGIGIDWGYMYVAATGEGMSQSMAQSLDARNGFANNGQLPGDNNQMPIACSDGWPVLAIAFDLGSIGPDAVERVILLGYDDVSSMNYFGTILKAYWTSIYSDILALLDQAWADHETLMEATVQFDTNLIASLAKIGGDQYATMGALAYRQVMGGTKLTINPSNGVIWHFMKEISSDGDVSTVDVIFPAAPFFMYMNPGLLALQTLPVLEYALNHTDHPYNLVWAPHHLGTWPIANIETDQQENMPVEETGNLILMIASTIKLGVPASTYDAYAGLFQQWADYLITVLPDPGNQLCTDDFEGPTPHDANLAVKGIVAIAAYGDMISNAGNTTGGEYYKNIAVEYAQKFVSLANPNNEDHYRLRYDQEGWSLKYNMVFQYFLNLTTFTDDVMTTEIAYYMKQMRQYGIPLDVRSEFTKYDWQAWVAAMCTQQSDFTAIIGGLYAFADNTPQRVPLSDWYWTTTSAQQGFQARTVVGGLYAKAAMSVMNPSWGWN